MIPVHDRGDVAISAQVTDPASFGARIDAVRDELVGRIGPAAPHVERGAHTPDPVGSAVRRADRLHQLWATVAAPVLAPSPTPRGRVGHALRRVERRLLSWYIEPRWEAQREIDAEIARSASDGAEGLADLQARVERLEAANEELRRQVRLLDRRSSRQGSA